MNVFISWSGNRSKAVAEILRDWIKCVIQATKPWVSTRDIDRGALWFSEINDQLKDTTVGIICLTQENKNRPWILFEAGALAKGLSSSRVCTLLVDLTPADLEDPLAQFNHTFPERESIWALVRTLNTCLGAGSLDERILEQVFSTYWGQFEQKFNAAIKNNPPTEKVAPRSEKNILTEILENTRTLHYKIRNLETRDERTSRQLKFPGWKPDTVLSTFLDKPNIFLDSVLSARNTADFLVKSGCSLEIARDVLRQRGLPEEIIDKLMEDYNFVNKNDSPNESIKL